MNRLTGTCDEVIKAWREGRTLRTPRSKGYIRMSTDGATLYSYDTPIGWSVGEYNENKTVTTDTKWSRTSKKHIRLTKQALHYRD